MDLEHADLIIIQGSNFAENHPVGFRFVTKAKERGAKVIHVDPRFTRTSALADQYLPIRSGTDIAFTGGIINYVLQNDAYFKEYVAELHQRVVHRRRAVRRHRGPRRDLLRLRSRQGHVRSEDVEVRARRKRRRRESEARQRADAKGGGTSRPAAAIPSTARSGPKKDLTLQHPRCAINLMRKHFARYTPEMVERICGTPVRSVRRACASSSSRTAAASKTMTYCYAMGWAQHTVGVQNIRAAATLQALLGNTGRPGGGMMALRGHASIQGSTDIATLYDLFPGYIKSPSLERGEDSFENWKKNWTKPTGLVVELAQVRRVADEGVVRRRGDRGERLGVRLPAAEHGRSLAHADVLHDEGRRRRRPDPVGPKPRGRRAERRACSAPRSAS